MICRRERKRNLILLIKKNSILRIVTERIFMCLQMNCSSSMKKEKPQFNFQKRLRISEQELCKTPKMVCFLLLSMRVLGIILKIIHFLKLVFLKKSLSCKTRLLMEKKTGFVLLMALLARI